MRSGVKINLYLSKELRDLLKREKERSGVPVSEIIRRAILQYLDKQETN